MGWEIRLNEVGASLVEITHSGVVGNLTSSSDFTPFLLLVSVGAALAKGSGGRW